VAFASLNLLLQTQALLSSLNYLTTIIPSDGQNMTVTKEVQSSAEKQKISSLQKGICQYLMETMGESLTLAHSFKHFRPMVTWLGCFWDCVW
jgi:hypothetical protein